jgi:enoyl-CoA hydratase/carnithine racemase
MPTPAPAPAPPLHTHATSPAPWCRRRRGWNTTASTLNDGRISESRCSCSTRAGRCPQYSLACAPHAPAVPLPLAVLHYSAMNTPDLTCFTLHSDHIAHLVLSRPEAMNTMGPAFWRELDQVLEQLHQGGQARVLVVSSTGKHFSAGMALEVFGGAIQMDDASPEGRAAIADLLAALQATFTKLETLRIPVIVAIQGGCVGGAVDMVTAACIRYATQDAFFCIQEINIGMVADVGTLQRLPKLVPLAVVKELAYTGRRLPAARARARPGQRGVRHARGLPGRRPAVRARDRRQAAGGHLGHQAGHPLRARPLGRRQPAPDGLGAGAIWSNATCARP